MNNWASQVQAQWHNLDILDFLNGAQQEGTQAQQIWQMNNWAPQDPAQWHNLGILDFFNGAQLVGTQAQQFL